MQSAQNLTENDSSPMAAEPPPDSLLNALLLRELGRCELAKCFVCHVENDLIGVVCPQPAGGTNIAPFVALAMPRVEMVTNTGARLECRVVGIETDRDLLGFALMLMSARSLRFTAGKDDGLVQIRGIMVQTEYGCRRITNRCFDPSSEPIPPVEAGLSAPPARR